MVVIMKREFTPEQLEAAVHTMEEGGAKSWCPRGGDHPSWARGGNAEHIDQEKLSLLPGVERVMRVTEPYKKANRKYHPEDTVIELSNGRSVGGNRLAVIAGPCSVESEAQIVGVAQAVEKASWLRPAGGAFKPRTSPYAFQGMGNDGIRLLQEAKEATGLPIVTEMRVHRQRGDVRDVRGRDSGGEPGTCRTSTCSSNLARPPSPSCSSGACPPPLRSGSRAPSTSWPGQPPGHPSASGYPHL